MGTSTATPIPPSNLGINYLVNTNPPPQYDQVNKRYGQPPLPAEKYDDIASLPRLITLPDEADHRDVDKVVLSTNHAILPPDPDNITATKVKTSIVAPPTIYGTGRGPVNTMSQQLPSLARFILQHKFAPSVGPTGKVEWDNIHISDVSTLLVTLVSIAATDPKRAASDAEIFGGQAYFFCENGTPHVWADVALEIAAEAVKQGYLKEVAARIVGYEDIPDKSWATNSRSVSSRARKYLGWKPKGPALKEEIPALVDGEARRLGLKKQ